MLLTESQTGVSDKGTGFASSDYAIVADVAR